MSSPAYLMYPDDFLSSGRVAALKPLEELWYRRAIDLGWKNGGMPSDPVEFAGWVGRGCSVDAAKKIIAKFYKPHKKDGERVINPRQEEERKKFQKKQRQKSDAGKRGMASRWKQRGNNDNSVITKDNIPIPIPIPITKEDKKEELREETPQAASTKKGTRLPEPFNLTADMRTYGQTKRPEIDLMLETEKFCNYWRAKTGKDATKLDWIATWRNWILNAKASMNGIGKPSIKADVGKYDASIVVAVADPVCGVCGKEYCLALHK